MRPLDGATVRVLGAPGVPDGQVVVGVVRRQLCGPAEGILTVGLLVPGQIPQMLECWAAKTQGDAETARKVMADHADTAMTAPVAWPDVAIQTLS